MSAPRVLILSSSQGYIAHARLALGPAFRVDASLTTEEYPGEAEERHGVVILHGVAPGDPRVSGQVAMARARGCSLAIAADLPRLSDMLEFSRYSVQAYFNSYMADVHYRQMVKLLAEGMTWFHPPMMAEALTLARRNLTRECRAGTVVLDALTRREREIAADVAAGMSNHEVAEARSIAERTVKAHLTRIFKKLGTRNRQELMLRVRGL
jgi:DNA-binding NarL/FixJ family response regulator